MHDEDNMTDLSIETKRKSSSQCIPLENSSRGQKFSFSHLPGRLRVRSTFAIILNGITTPTSRRSDFRIRRWTNKKKKTWRRFSIRERLDAFKWDQSDIYKGILHLFIRIGGHLLAYIGRWRPTTTTANSYGTAIHSDIFIKRRPSWMSLLPERARNQTIGRSSTISFSFDISRSCKMEMHNTMENRRVHSLSLSLSLSNAPFQDSVQSFTSFQLLSYCRSCRFFFLLFSTISSELLCRSCFLAFWFPRVGNRQCGRIQ